ncbi:MULTISPECIES: hypothetical protein [Nostocales]|uniref:Uncharacterized protein n=3 Tax=Nostocales TaxID=1161 RepID=A0A8S9SY82_9CYAN|nr:hypothetical protein [Tolypothrix bouteillei]KAF3885311.1 hypothetical protein DA73_0400007445 [Tolypothrix bouteillei VB521301]
MNTGAIAALTAMAATIGICGTAYGQSLQTPQSNQENYTIQGGSLTGIGNRSAENDYSRFFSDLNAGNSSRTGVQVAPTGVIPISDRVELRQNDRFNSNNVIIPQGGNQPFENGNAVEVQVTPR